MIEIKNQEIEVYLAGPGYGEGCFITIGKTIALGIDCCRSFIDEKQGYPYFLKSQFDELDKDAHVFWVLTHFHYDHLQGFSTVLDRYGERFTKMVLPLNYTEADIWRDIVAVEAKDSLQTTESYFKGANAYDRLRQEIFKKNFDKKILSFAGGPIPLLNTTLKTSTGQTLALNIDVYGPEYHEFTELQSKAMKRLTHTPEEKAKHRALANEGSYIVHVEVGGFEGIFLGDAISVRAEQLKALKKHSSKDILCLKIAHHGSDDGTDENLLDIVSGAHTTFKVKDGIVAPFTMQGLPKDHILDLLRDRGFALHVCSVIESYESEKRIQDECGFLARATIASVTPLGKGIIRRAYAFGAS